MPLWMLPSTPAPERTSPCGRFGGGLNTSARQLHQGRPPTHALTGGPRCRPPTSQPPLVHVRKLLQYIRVFKRGSVLIDLPTFCNQTEQTPHDLARTRLGQTVAEADVAR